DDEFAQSVDLADVDELKEKIQEHILRSKRQIAQEALNERLLEKLLESSTVHVADTAWEGVAERRLAEIREELKKQGSTLAEYAKHNGMEEEDFVSAQKNEARTQVQRAVLIERIFNKEGMKVTDQDASEQFVRIAYENRVPEADIKKFAKEYGPQIRDEVVYRTMYSKVMRLINQEAKITEVEVPSGQGGGN
ncbi:MAG TPA: hypothetical protein VNI20_02770, partial [Fimbriimonadaceae bacterium]|nr:hypothetical protein [Fimbriimonadaceae bacterium]